MTPRADVTVRLATQRDVAGIVDLESRYFVDNLDESARAKGFISVLHSPHWFAAAVDSRGMHVAATTDGHIAGFIAVTDPPSRTSADLPPIVRAMLDIADTIDVNGKKVAAQRWALRGPVCIDEAFRGGGIYGAFNAATGNFYRYRYDIGVVFVAAENPRSLHTTTTKLGARSLAEFEVDSARYHFLVFDFGDPGQPVRLRRPLARGGDRQAVIESRLRHDTIGVEQP